MSQKRKVLNEDSSNIAAASSKTPNCDRYNADLKRVIDRVGGIFIITVKGIEFSDEEDSKEGDEEDSKDYPTEKLNEVRMLIITERRRKLCEKYEKFVDPNDGWSNTNTGNTIIFNIPKEVKKIAKIKDISEKFDSLLCLTFNLNDNDMWMRDNECWGEKGDGNKLDECIQLLSKAWKGLIGKSNEELCIDPEYTRPGLECLLETFAENVDGAEAVNEPFKYIC